MPRTVLLCVLISFTLWMAPRGHAQAAFRSQANSVFSAAGSTYQPLNVKERWDEYLHDNFESPGSYIRAFGASIGEHYPRNPPNWPAGASGYFADVGSQFGRFSIGGTIDATMAATLQFDPRYIPCHCGGALRRTAHAALRTFITYDRDGRRVPDVPGLAGTYGGSMLMMYWYPRGYGPLTTGVQVGTFSLGVEGVVNIVKEFAPDIRHGVHKLAKGRHRDQACAVHLEPINSSVLEDTEC